MSPGREKAASAPQHLRDSERELERWAQRLNEWRAGQELFVYLNNDWEAFAPRNAQWLIRRLHELQQEHGRR